MKLVDGMKNERLGSALLYNFTKGYGQVPMTVYNIVLPLLYNDVFRDLLIETKDVMVSLHRSNQEQKGFKSHVLNQMGSMETITSKALGIALLNKDLDFQIVDGTMYGVCNETTILDLNEALILGQYFRGKELEEIIKLLETIETRIVFLDCQTLGQDVDVTKLERFGRVTILSDVKEEEIKEQLMDATIVITNKKNLGKEQLCDAKGIRLICVTATGFNNIDLDYCHQSGITVCNVKGYSTNSVVQHTFALLLDLYNKNHYYHRYIDSGNYSSSSMFTHFTNTFNELTGKTWGIVGMGDIGRGVATIASAFGCKLQYYSTSGKNTNQSYLQVNFDTLLSTSDIISIHAPLNLQTMHLFNQEAFNKMKNTAYLINVGRGSIICEDDLAMAIKEGKIAGAGLDVFEKEPFFKDSPLLTIKDPTKLIMTPHIAWATVEARNRVIEEVCKNIESFMSGTKRNVC